MSAGTNALKLKRTQSASAKCRTHECAAKPKRGQSASAPYLALKNVAEELGIDER